MCHRCAASGSWYDLKRRAGSGGARLMSQAVVSPKAAGTPNAASTRRTAGSQPSLTVQQQRSSGFRPIPDQRRVGSYPVNLFHNPRFREVKKYLTGQRGIDEGVLIKYGVGCATYRCALSDEFTRFSVLRPEWLTAAKIVLYRSMSYRGVVHRAGCSIEPAASAASVVFLCTRPTNCVQADGRCVFAL